MEIIHLEERTADPAAIEMLPESFIVNNEIVPVCFEKGDLLVACAFPVDPDILEEAATISGMTTGGADTCRPGPEDAVGDGNYNRREEKSS